MQLNSFQKAKVVFLVNSIALFVLIVTTPYFIRWGVFSLSEELAEGVFLAIELLALMYFFRQYDTIVRKRDEEAWLLDVKLKSKERELLNAFQYLGKVNVEISMIKTLLEKMRIPSSKSQMHDVYAELLRLVCSITNKHCAALRIVNIENGRTLIEHVESIEEQDECDAQIRVGNIALVKHFKDKSKHDLDECCVFFSEAENFYAKAFVFVRNHSKIQYTKEERAFLEAVANQCEIMYLLFNSRYYKG